MDLYRITEEKSILANELEFSIVATETHPYNSLPFDVNHKVAYAPIPYSAHTLHSCPWLHILLKKYDSLKDFKFTLQFYLLVK